jgi:signal transduction histidine kinase
MLAMAATPGLRAALTYVYGVWLCWWKWMLFTTVFIVNSQKLVAAVKTFQNTSAATLGQQILLAGRSEVGCCT